MNRDDHLCWFHGKVTRENAEELLKTDENEDGTFLVRESNTAIGDYVLTVLYQGEVCHYQIRRHGEDAFFSIDDKIKILHGLDTLIEFYQQASNGLVTKLTKMLRKDAPPNDSRSHGTTNLLHRATKENNECVVSELLKCGYRNVDAKNQDGQTAVHLAALHSDETILKLLVNASVNVNCMDTSGNTPLHYACRKQSASFVRTLINAHANVQGRNIRNGYVPLHEAAKHGNLEVVQELLSAHAPHLPRTSSGEFPIDLAKEASQFNVVEFLENYKPPTPSTFESKWYHGTLKRADAINTLTDFAAAMQKEHEEQMKKFEFQENTENSNTSKEQATTPQDDNGNKISPINTSGCFLVRFSERKDAGSGYVLTLLWDNNVKNFVISQSSNYLYIDGGPYLPSLEHLVDHFMRFADGLPVNLRYPVVPKPKPPLPHTSTMPRGISKKADDQLLSLTVDHNKLFKDNTLRKHSLDALSPQQIHDAEKHAHTLNPKQKKHKENSIFNTLKLRKFKAKSPASTEEKKSPNKPLDGVDQLRKAEPLLKNLSFSIDFSNLQLADNDSDPVPGDGFYNVPKNNSSVLELKNNDVQLDVSGKSEDSTAIESKTEEEVEYFTKSDVAIERERSKQLFEASPTSFATNANGYIPTVDVRVFMDHSPLAANFSKEALEASAAELREFSNHPERLDSLISTTSTESEMMRYFNRQCSGASTITQNSEAAAVAGQSAKFSYFIPRDCLELDTIIGEGEFGSVYKGCLVRRNSETLEVEARCEVAIKTLRDEHCRTNKEEFLREASVMIRLQHHCIVQLIGISKGKTLMMVQEIVSLGSMLNFILDNKKKINPNYELKLWASQIACGMQYLESHHFVHRDLAARNILLASRNQAKISDFGLSRALGSGNECYQASQGGKWPIKWYAPESYNNGRFSHASDVWSFGVTLWEMFSLGEPPYGELRGIEAIQLIDRGERLLQPTLCPPHVFEIMKNCWNYKPKDRPNFRYLTDFFAKDPDYQNIMELVRTEHIS